MKKFITLLIAFAFALSLCACGKSEAVKNAESLIAAIGEVTLDSESAIVAAEEAYATLTAEEKEQVENYSVLIDAKAEIVEILIDEIGDVTLDSEAAIVAAEEAYAALTAEEKALVENYAVLTDARATFDPMMVEELRRQEYYGEWTMIPSGNILILDLNGILHLKGQDQNWYDQEWTLTDNGVSFTYWVDLTKVDCGDYIKLVGESEIGGEKIELFRTEDLTAKDIEITIDNWQDYFYIEETVERYFDAFGEENGYVIHYDFRVKPEYVNYLVASSINTGTTSDLIVEYRLEHSGIYVNIDSETLEYTLGETEWQGGNPITNTKNLRCFDLFIFNNWEKYGYNPENFGYEMSICTLWNTSVIENHRMASKPDYFSSEFPSNLEITRIKGTLSLYELPIHQ